jgi:hypothetical protein
MMAHLYARSCHQATRLLLSAMGSGISVLRAVVTGRGGQRAP